MLHAYFIPIALCFVYTSWHFYVFSGTNLLTRCYNASSCFLLFFYFSFLLKKIFSELDETSQSVYLSDTKTESKGETETSQEPVTPGGGAAQPLVAPPHGVGPSGAHRPCPFVYKFIYSGKP
jgi:hypothetical protein